MCKIHAVQLSLCLLPLIALKEQSHRWWWLFLSSQPVTFPGGIWPVIGEIMLIFMTHYFDSVWLSLYALKRTRSQTHKIYILLKVCIYVCRLEWVVVFWKTADCSCHFEQRINLEDEELLNYFSSCCLSAQNNLYLAGGETFWGKSLEWINDRQGKC